MSNFQHMEEDTASRLGSGERPIEIKPRVLIVITIVSMLIAIIAIIIASVAFARYGSASNDVKGRATEVSDSQQQRLSKETPVAEIKGSGVETSMQRAIQGRTLLQYSQGNYMPTPNSWPRVWSVAIGHDYGAHEYIDTDGYLAGFSHDLVNAVCRARQLDCRLIWEPYSNCWQTLAGQHASGGKGLLGGWYDACTAWVKTVSRIHVFKFSQAFLKPKKARFYIKKGGSFDVTTANSKKVGFLDGYANDEKCMARFLKSKNYDYKEHSKDEVKKYVIYYPTTDLMKTALLQGEIDAIFGGEQEMEKYVMSNDFERSGGGEFSCMLDGNGMIMRKDNQFDRFFNEGLNKIIESGQYKQICDKATKDHKDHGLVACVNT